MVYIKSDGTVCEKPPVYERVYNLIFGLFSGFIFFFTSMFGFNSGGLKGRSSGGSGRYGGGGGDGPYKPGKPGGSNFRTISDINPPTVYGGGCPGGNCGL
ncbi:glycine-rich selenoprotein-like [Sitophilus oryzae]|uniref:Glycine-rich selenoprotein-like n=1 Tax=Sitophilus oryzae TaxID=7048 RepID=A0A6J2XIY8_SITOR|nr:glycine-rich selenoprotein-like [Sitophilus oryzae]